MVEVDLRSSSGEALKQLGYPSKMLRKSDHLLQTAERRSEAPLAHAPAPHPVRASVVQRHQPDVRFGGKKREIDQPIIARKRNTQAKIMLGTSGGERSKSTRASHAASHFVLIDAYPSFSYSRLASCCMGMFESAFFQSSKKWSYASRLFALSPISAAARASPR